ncbi:MAG: hypothetical protein Ct9H300mP25_12560 [Acidobacteriota bacterium]|nr:MAG: hypothetical protein Ct9H300mP25_12560 [Acidobacteriota bacterium]
MEHIRYSVATCQTDLPNPTDRLQMHSNTTRMLEMVDSAVTGSMPFLPVRLVVFPEFAHAAPIYQTAAELLKKLAVSIPNEHTEKLTAKAREHTVYIQTGTMLEEDPKYPGAIFNTSCLIGPDGILTKYRKVNPWIPFEVHTSPHDIPSYDEPLFPVADTAIGRLGCAICYDWFFPGKGSPSINRQRGGSAGSCLGLYGPMGGHRTHGMVDHYQSSPRLGKSQLCRCGESGRKLTSLPTILMARWVTDRRLRRQATGGGLPWPWRTDCHCPDRHIRITTRTSVTHRPSHAGASSYRGLRCLPTGRLFVTTYKR